MKAPDKRFGILLLLVSAAALAAFEYADYLAALCTRESGCNAASINQAGFLGNYQMGEAALIDAGYYTKDNTPGKNDWQGTWTGKNGIYSKADFLASAALQAQAINDYNAVQWRYIVADGSDRFLGQTINGLLITESGLLAGAHLVGHAGLYRFLASNGQTVPRDGNQVAVTRYIGKFSGYDIVPVTGHVSPLGLGNVPTAIGDSGADVSYLASFNESALPSSSIAFENGAGASYTEVLGFIQATIALLLLLWTAFVSYGQFKLWGERSLSFYVMQANILKATVLMMLLMTIVLL